MTTEILALIEERSYPVKELAAVLHVNHWKLRYYLELLEQRGYIVVEREPGLPNRISRSPLPPPLEELPTPRRGRAQARKTWQRRLDGERIEASSMPAPTDVSWWLGLDRQQFQDEAQKRAVAMSATKIGRSIRSTQLLAWKGHI